MCVCVRACAPLEFYLYPYIIRVLVVDVVIFYCLYICVCTHALVFNLYPYTISDLVIFCCFIYVCGVLD